jgi:hypothetical protein
MRRWSHRQVLAAGAAATFLVLVGGYFFPLADRAWAGAVLAIVVAGPFIAGAVIFAWQRQTVDLATAAPLRRPRWRVGALGLALWGVAPIVLITHIRLDRAISDLELVAGLLSPLIGGVLVGVATRGQGRRLAWAFGLLAAGTFVTLVLMEPGGRGAEATVALLVVLVPAAAIGLGVGGFASLVAARMSR